MAKSDSALVKITNQQAPSGFVLCMAYIGAVIYFFQQSPNFWGFILALLKAIVWPAYVLYSVLNFFHVQ